MKKIMKVLFGNNLQTKRKVLQVSMWMLDALVFIGLGMITVLKNEFDSTLWWFAMVVLITVIYVSHLNNSINEVRR